MSELEPLVLKLDGLSRVTSSFISDHTELNPGLKLRIREGVFQTYRGKTSKQNMDKLAEILTIPEKPLILNTRGTYHHVTYSIVKSLEPELGYIHIDNHPDTYSRKSYPSGSLASGTFVSDIYELQHVSDMMFVGCNFEPFRSITRKDLISGNWKDDIKEKVRELPDKVYISIDLDVFPTPYIDCPFGQGVMTFQQFFFLVREIQEEKEVIGADICGIDRPHAQKDRNFYNYVADLLLGKLDKSDVESIESKARKNLEKTSTPLLKERNKYLLNQ